MSTTINQSSCQAIPLTRSKIPGGFCMTPHHFSMNRDFTDREIRVWLILQAYAKGGDVCFPSIETLAESCGCCAKIMRRTLASMEKKGLVVRTEREGKTTLYSAASADNIPTPGTKLPGSKSSRGGTMFQGSKGKKSPGVPLEQNDPRIILREDKNSSLPDSSSKNLPEKSVAPPVVGDDRPTLRVVEKPVKPAKPKKDPAPSKILIDFWHDEYLSRRGEKPRIVGGRDGALFNSLLKTYPLDEIKRRLVAYLDDPLEWMTLPNWTLPAFVNRIGAYTPDAQPRQPRPARQERITKLPPNWMEIKE